MKRNGTLTALSTSRGLSFLTALMLSFAGLFAAAPAGASGGIVGDASYKAPDRVAPGEAMTVSGDGWKNQAGTEGSVIAVKIDEGAVNTKSTVKNPVTGRAEGDKSAVAMVKADASGKWNAAVPAETLAQLKPGKHTVQLLSGSALQGDVTRRSTLNFTYGNEGRAPNPNPNPEQTAPSPAPPNTPLPKPDQTPPPADGTPSWSHLDLTDGSGAKAWVEKDIKSSSGSKFRVKGTGWLNKAKGPSTVAVKINKGKDDSYFRPDGAIDHPSVKGKKDNNTIWALFSKVDPAGNENVRTIDSNGNFEAELDVPEGVQKGQYFTVTLLSGEFDDKDVARSLTTNQLTVDGQTHAEDGGDQAGVCKPSVADPTVHIDTPNVSLGGKVKVSGKGWCHPVGSKGASVIAVELDEGKYSHVHGKAVNANPRIWAIVDNVNQTTGDWTAEIQLPDGTTATSTPAFPQGSHVFRVFRLSTGPWKDGDKTRTLKSDGFVVGEYKPSRTPDPLEATKDLKDSTKNGLKATRSGDSIVVTVPKAKEGDWVYLDAYDAEGTSRHPWKNQWFRTDKQGRVTASLKEAILPYGTFKLTAQSGNPGKLFSSLLGWTSYEGPQRPPAPGGGGNQGGNAGNQGGNAGNQGGNSGGQAQTSIGGSNVIRRSVATGVSRSVVPGRYAVQGAYARLIGAQQAQQQKPAQPNFPKPNFTPPPPVPNERGLTLQNAGNIGKQMEGKVLVLFPAGRQPGEWIFLYVYPQGSPLGWTQIDKQGKIRVDTSVFPDGSYKFALIDSTGKLIGWTDLDVGNVKKKKPNPTSSPTKDDAGAQAKVEEDTSQPIWPWMLGGALISVTIVGAALIASKRQSK